jgi:hypothetical protein
MRPSRVDDLFADQDEPYPDIRQQPGSAPGQLDEAGNASGPRQPHLGQVVERGDTHVLVDMLRSGEDVPPAGAGEALLHGRLARERRCRPGGRDEVVTADPGGSYNHPSPLGRPNTPTPLALGRGPIGGEPCPMCAREHHDHDQEAHNAPRVALVRLRRALGACKAARAQQGAGPPRRLVQGDRALQRVTKVVRP